LSPDQVADLIASGVTSAANLQNFRFFTNDFDTTTEGVDIVATWPLQLFGGDSDISLSFNQTETEVDSFTPGVIDSTRIRELQEGLPETRWNLSWTQFNGPWRFLTRLSYYDEYFDSEDDQVYGDEFIVDAEVAYDYNDNLTITLGAQNLLDEFPDENPNAAAGVGNLYGQYSPTGFGGGYYYVRLSYGF